MSDDASAPSSPSTVVPSTGMRLRAARESAGLSVEDVASKLKLSVRQVNAIEIEDWDALPERTFTRGFVRGYARLVGIDESTLQINTPHPTPEIVLPPTPRGIGEISHDGGSSRNAVPRWLIPGVLVTLLTAGIAWFVWHDMPMPTATSKLPMSAAKKSADTDNAANAGSTLSAPTSTAPAVITLPPPSSSTAANTTSANAASAGNVATATTPPVATPPPLAVLTVPTPNAALAANDSKAANTAPTVAPSTESPAAVKPGQKRIGLTFAGRSWTEIRSKGDVVFSETVSSGNRDVVATPPISFVVGSSSNVSITVDGKPYDFSSSVRNEVARFRIE
jgi:cytoskeleton protein RodZ